MSYESAASWYARSDEGVCAFMLFEMRYVRINVLSAGMTQMAYARWLLEFLHVHRSKRGSLIVVVTLAKLVSLYGGRDEG